MRISRLDRVSGPSFSHEIQPRACRVTLAPETVGTHFHYHRGGSVVVSNSRCGNIWSWVATPSTCAHLNKFGDSSTYVEVECHGGTWEIPARVRQLPGPASESFACGGSYGIQMVIHCAGFCGGVVALLTAEMWLPAVAQPTRGYSNWQAESAYCLFNI